MADYPRLTEMGVLHPKHIVHFSVNSIEFTDHLRLFYERPKGSLLPDSRTYKFPRVQKSGDKGAVMASNPALLEAVTELETLLGKRGSKEELAAAILKELKQLEEDVAIRSDCIKNLVERLQTL